MRYFDFSVAMATALLLGTMLWLTPLAHADKEQPQGSPAVYESSWLVSDRPDERVCISEDKRKPYTCTTRGDQIEMEFQRGHRYNLGVAQRIDGSETEKEGIREVISSMKGYFF